MKDDKKKLIVLAALVVVVLGVGVFQLASGSSKPAPKPATTKTTTAEETTASTTEGAGSELANSGTESNSGLEGAPEANTAGVLATNSYGRDPFDGGALMHSIEAPKTGKPTQAAPTTQPAMQTPPPRRPTGLKGSGFVDPGNVPYAVEGLPSPNGNPGTGGTSVQPGEKIPHPDDFNYTLSGVITGERPAAVFTDDKGNQQLIQLGGSLGPETKVTKISNGRVTVRHRGKTKTLTVGGDPAPTGGNSK